MRPTAACGRTTTPRRYAQKDAPPRAGFAGSGTRCAWCGVAGSTGERKVGASVEGAWFGAHVGFGVGEVSPPVGVGAKSARLGPSAPAYPTTPRDIDKLPRVVPYG